MRLHFVTRLFATTFTFLLAATATLIFHGNAAALQNPASAFMLPQGQQFTNTGRQLVSISPDGTQMVYVANQQLYIHRIGETQSRPISGTLTPQGITNPVFSPDGRSVAYWSGADQMFKRIPVEGGTPVSLFRGTNPYGMSWSADDRVVVGQGPTGILSAPAAGGTAETIVTIQQGQGGALTPQILPGGNLVLFTLASSPGNWDASAIVVQNLKTGERKTVVQGGHDARYLPSGHLVFTRGGNLLAVRFDIQRLEVAGAPVTVLENVQTAGNGSSHFSFSGSGPLVYIPPLGQLQLSAVNLDGTVRDIGKLPATTFAPRISPDGKQLVYNTQGTDEAIWIYDLATGAQRQLTTRARGPLWSPDGTYVVYISGDVTEMLYSQKADGSAPRELLVDPARAPESWSTRDQLLSFITLKAGATLDYDIWTYSPRDKKAVPVIEVATSAQHSSRFSPDGRWIAYVSNETGTYEVFVQPYPTTGAKFQITKGGGLHPVWSPDGRQIYFDNAERLFSVQMQTQPSVQFSQPVLMPISGFLAGAVNTRRRYDLTPDGKQFLMMFQKAEIRIVPKWADDVRARVK